MVHTPDQQVYIRKLLGFHFRIEYKPGHTNQVADSLSRVHETMSSVDIYYIGNLLSVVESTRFRLGDNPTS